MDIIPKTTTFEFDSGSTGVLFKAIVRKSGSGAVFSTSLTDGQSLTF